MSGFTYISFYLLFQYYIVFFCSKLFPFFLIVNTVFLYPNYQIMANKITRFACLSGSDVPLSKGSKKKKATHMMATNKTFGEPSIFLHSHQKL